MDQEEPPSDDQADELDTLLEEIQRLGQEVEAA